MSDDNFQKPWRGKFIFAHLHGIRVKFVYEGYRVKVEVKVTGAKKKSKIPVPAM